jgi:hypothetical protein
MSVKLRGLSSVIKRLYRDTDRVKKHSESVLRWGANLMLEEARAHAPVDEGFLEKAIDLKENKQGIRGRLQIDVGVFNLDALGPGYTRWGFNYAVFTHEHYKNRGELSQAKAEANGRDVGGKYLVKAFNRVEPQVRERLRRLK